MLAVHEVPEPPHREPDERAEGGDIETKTNVVAAPPGEDDGGCKAHHQGTPDGDATFSDAQDPGRILGEPLPVLDHVESARADDPRRQTNEERRVGLILPKLGQAGQPERNLDPD